MEKNKFNSLISIASKLFTVTILAISIQNYSYGAEKNNCSKLFNAESLENNHSFSNEKVFTNNIPGAWSNFIHYERNDETPTAPVIEALTLYKKTHATPIHAVDLGIGGGKDTLYLLKNGAHVLDVDFSQEALNVVSDRAQTKRLPAPEVQLSNFTSMTLPDNIDMINASKSLPYVSPERFPEVWQNVNDHLRRGGIFSGSFFTENDGYSIDHAVTTLTRPQLMCMFKNYNIISLKEKTSDAHTSQQ